MRYVKLGNKGEGGGRVQGLEVWDWVLKLWYQGRVEGNGEWYGYRQVRYDWKQEFIIYMSFCWKLIIVFIIWCGIIINCLIVYDLN